MASNPDLVQYIADQMNRAGEITSKKMFGEYGLDCNGKFFAMVCDDRLLFKPTEGGRALLGTPVLQLPYPGAKPCFYIENVDDHELLVALAKLLARNFLNRKSRRNEWMFVPTPIHSYDKSLLAYIEYISIKFLVFLI